MSAYKPLQLGIPAQHKLHVSYNEFYPQIKSPVYCFWSLRTQTVLTEDFHYLVLPDACVDIVFDVSQKPAFEGAVVMTPSTVASTLNLGRNFCYIGVRLLPGAWRERPGDVMGRSLEFKSLKNYDLCYTRQQLQAAMPSMELPVLQNLVANLEQCGVIGKTPFSQETLQRQSVEHYVQAWGVSRRHVQRLFQKHFGCTPHDFIKITRFQQSLRQNLFESYSDQSHYIRECKRITKLTPREFQAAYR